MLALKECATTSTYTIYVSVPLHQQALVSLRSLSTACHRRDASACRSIVATDGPVGCAAAISEEGLISHADDSQSLRPILDLLDNHLIYWLSSTYTTVAPEVGDTQSYVNGPGG